MSIIIIVLIIFAAVLPFYLIDRRERINIMKTNFNKSRDAFEDRWTNLSDSCNHYTNAVLNVSYEEMEKNNFSLYSLTSRGRTQRAKQIDTARQRLEQWQNFYAPFSELADSKLLDPDHYGSIQSGYWDSIQTLSKEDADALMAEYSAAISSGMPDLICSIQIDAILLIVWRYATDKVYSAQSFEQAVSVFRTTCDIAGASHLTDHIDILLSEFYAFKSMGGDGAIQSRIRDFLKKDVSAEQLTQLSSGLMWLGAYREEATILQHMLSSGMEMSRKAQQRLQSLSTAGGNGPSILNITCIDNSLHFDVSALAWKDNDYSSLFDNLAFQDQKLTYALAVRDEMKELTLPAGIKLSDLHTVSQKLTHVFSNEYDTDASVKLLQCTAHSGVNEEPMECILTQCSSCNQMGLLIYIIKVGKTLTIKFYTLFMPYAVTNVEQKQQALSLHNNLSPTVSVWESSMKASALKGIQELLNSGSNSTPGADPSSENNDPVF